MKSLQPDCLMLDNSHLMSPWENDLAGVEEAQGNAFVPADNTFPAVQMQKINAAGGNDWFWAPNVGSLMTRRRSSTDAPQAHRAAVDELPAQLPAQPRRPAAAGDRHAAGRGRRGLGARHVAAAAARAAAADRRRRTIRSARPRPAATAATPSTARTTGTTTRVWQSSGALPQSVTVDLGQERPDVVRAELRPALRRAGRPEHRRRDHVVRVLGQHRRRHVHHGRERGLARQRLDEDGVVRSGRRALRAPRSDGGQRRQRGGDRDRRRRAPLSRPRRRRGVRLFQYLSRSRPIRRRASRCGRRGPASRRSRRGSAS